ncbi:hypothetical protein SEA_LUCKYSOCKE_135 [Streptomyces phage LuckySocke]|jgi:hypothetical protein|nr:hypothetical protein SEA_ALONE_140 [Streptomyces phage Alone3]WPH58933.1 hypothetical protein SEA_LUCKYSOCKE_135 [Streptomyces phage LuckySocke]
MESNELLSKFFPGSTTPLDIEEKQKTQQHESDQWDLKPYIFTVKGKEMQFFPIGALALALGGRSPNTLRAWEKEGILPKSVFVKPSKDPRGRRRMYTRAMVEGLVRIAKEEGIFWPDKGKKLSDTVFTEKAVELFKQCNKT